MRAKILLLGLICLFIFSFCKSPADPEIEEIIKPKANIVLDGELNGGYHVSSNLWGFTGYVKNNGNGTGYNCMVEIQCFSDSNKTTIIDTAFGFPADLGDIGPGIRAYFEAIAFNAKSMQDITFTSVKITWLDRGY
ncbi:MAG: hypothetical protein HQ555_02345 [Candidatus Aminicenantes bacterium]|nr:hypothetical protein [Candidatus Aminicenantes bacterium]